MDRLGSGRRAREVGRNNFALGTQRFQVEWLFGCKIIGNCQQVSIRVHKICLSKLDASQRAACMGCMWCMKSGANLMDSEWLKST
jgi:hypothetical protein